MKVPLISSSVFSGSYWSRKRLLDRRCIIFFVAGRVLSSPVFISPTCLTWLYTLRPRQYGCHFIHDIFQSFVWKLLYFDSNITDVYSWRTCGDLKLKHYVLSPFGIMYDYHETYRRGTVNTNEQKISTSIWIIEMCTLLDIFWWITHDFSATTLCVSRVCRAAHTLAGATLFNISAVLSIRL